MDLIFVSGQQIIDKVNRDFNFGDAGSSYDIAQWIVDGLEQIGTLHIYKRMNIVKTVTDNKVELVCGIEKLSDVFYNDKCLMWTNFKPCCPTTTTQNYNCFTVSLDPPYLKFNFTDKEVNINYLAIPVDAEGFPMIPDNPFVREALSWYVAFKMMLSGNSHPVLNIKMCSEMWIDFKAKAQNSLNTPYANTIDETFKSFRSGNAYPLTT